MARESSGELYQQNRQILLSSETDYNEVWGRLKKIPFPVSDEPPQSHTITYDDRIGVLACNSIDTLSVHKVDALGRLFMTSFRPQDTQCTTAPGHSPYGTRP